jgi:hypothetical protein
MGLDGSGERSWELGDVAFFAQTLQHEGAAFCDRSKAWPEPLRKVGAPGTAWCDGCNEFLPTSSFNRNKSK